ncbi:MAG: N-acetylmannosamine-6-phosphate 2-epimerase [Clostridia bacterium]|nr:N-acetylmannosamine-6-phosphate 2-epimerase [Clostridia bacterium]
MAELNRGLIVSCQAVKGEPLYGLNMMGHFARAAVLGGAVGIRTGYISDIKSVRSEVDVPIIGIIKQIYEGSDVYITPTLDEVKALIDSPCDVIALDCTLRARPKETLEELVKYIRANAPSMAIMADCDNLESAAEADRLGFDYIGTTMRGYTQATKGMEIPDYDFIARLVELYPDRRIIAEGGIWERGQLDKVWSLGVYAVVIGSAITRPMDITKRFAQVIK